MKKARKLTAVLLSLVMLLALVVPASAAENYSITIHNDKTGHTYEAYQIFAGTVSSDAATDGEAEGPMLGDITWGSGVDDARYAELLAALKADATIGAFEGMEDAADAAAVAAALDGATAETAAAFADVVSDYLAETPTGDTNTMTGGTYVIEGLPAGYYLVKDKDDTLDGTADTATDYIVQVLGNVAMEPKDSGIPTVLKKVYDEEFAVNDEEGTYGTGYNDVADWDIGDRVPFKLIAAVPQNIDSYEEYTFIFHDTLSAGLTLDPESLHVYVTETTNANINEFLPQNEDLYDVSDVDVDGSFTVTIPNIKALNSHDHAANFIIVAYDAILNANAEIGLDGNPNSVSLEFSNDPNGDGLGRTAAPGQSPPPPAAGAACQPGAADSGRAPPFARRCPGGGRGACSRPPGWRPPPRRQSGRCPFSGRPRISCTAALARWRFPAGAAAWPRPVSNPPPGSPGAVSAL